jgi:cobalt-zinc-cadmium efflux system outer membrane protein
MNRFLKIARSFGSSDVRHHRGWHALIAAVLTGVLSVGYAAGPNDPSATQIPHAVAFDSSATLATPFMLTLDQAMGRALDKHPDLKLFGYIEKTRQADADIAAQRPPIVAGLRMQNALGTQETTGFKNAEIALTLASVLERGGKREARQALTAGQLDALGAARETKRLDLLAEVARRYLDVVAAQAEATIAALDIVQRERTVVAAAKRVQAGASPESARLTAEALQARAQIDRARANREVGAAYRRLAILWNDRDPTTSEVAGDILSLPEVPDFGVLATLLETTPDLKRFADETRIREARLQLARSARAPDLNWEVGVQRLQDFGSSWGVVAGVTVPLGTARRAEPEVRASEGELQALALERESSEFTLYATLAQAYGQYVTGKAEAEACRDDLLPRLARAETAAEHAYRAGALSYLEWAQVQSETMAVHKQQLAAAIEAQRALIEIQRLTGNPFINATAPKDPAP